jgi:hypothetical protein
VPAEPASSRSTTRTPRWRTHRPPARYAPSLHAPVASHNRGQISIGEEGSISAGLDKRMICGSNVPARSLGVSIRTAPARSAASSAPSHSSRTRTARRLQMRLIANVAGQLDLHRAPPAASSAAAARPTRGSPPRPGRPQAARQAPHPAVASLTRSGNPPPREEIPASHQRGDRCARLTWLAPRSASGTRTLHLDLCCCRRESPFDTVPTQHTPCFRFIV